MEIVAPGAWKQIIWGLDSTILGIMVPGLECTLNQDLRQILKVFEGYILFTPKHIK